MSRLKVNISDTDENADWIKHLPGHEDELKIHEELAKEYDRDRKQEPPEE